MLRRVVFCASPTITRHTSTKWFIADHQTVNDVPSPQYDLQELDLPHIPQPNYFSIFQNNRFFDCNVNLNNPFTSNYKLPPFSPLPKPGPTPSLYKMQLQNSNLKEIETFEEIISRLCSLTTLPNKFETVETVRRLNLCDIYDEEETLKERVFDLLVSNGGYLFLQGLSLTAHLFTVPELCQTLDCLDSLGFTAENILCSHVLTLLSNEDYRGLPLTEAAIFVEVLVSLHRKQPTDLTRKLFTDLRCHFLKTDLCDVDSMSRANIYGFMCIPPADVEFGRRMISDTKHKSAYLDILNILECSLKLNSD